MYPIHPVFSRSVRLPTPLKNQQKIQNGRIYRKFDYPYKTNFSFRGFVRQQVEKFSVLNTEGVKELATARQIRIDQHKLSVQNDFLFEKLKHEDNTKKMIEMGFTDESLNLHALIESNGSINDAIGKSTDRFERHAICMNIQ